MREKQFRLIVTFYTTADAMATEKYCHQHQIEGRLIPVPRAVTSDCGIAWSCAPEQREVMEQAAKALGITPAGLYEMLV